MDIQSALTRKIGPLPAWGWGVGIGGGALALKLLRGGGGSGGQRETIVVPTGAPQPSGDYLGQFSEALADVRARLDYLSQPSNNNQDNDANEPGPTTPQPPTSGGTSNRLRLPFSVPAGFDLGTWIIGLRQRFPDIARRATQPSVPGETPAQRLERLMHELPAYGVGRFDLGTYVQGLRALNPSLKFSEQQRPGETPAERTARLWREVAFFAAHGKTSLHDPTVTPAPSVS